MWKLLEISQKTYFIYCNLSNTQDVTFILYDLNTTWSQTLTLQDVKKNVKLLNKRFDFNEDNIKDALTKGTIESAVLEDPLKQDTSLLKLKYNVKNCILNYVWDLTKQDLRQFQQTFIQPLLLGLLGCHQQVEVLSDSIRKKDMELKQYQIEGAVLNRKTLATKPFDFEDFNMKFEDCNKQAMLFRELAKYVKQKDLKESAVIKMLNKTELDIERNENLKSGQITTTKMNPRQRKRKANELKMQYLEQHLKLLKKGIVYESSQSQDASRGNSQNIEEAAIKEMKHREESTTEKSKRELMLSPRRSTRCADIQQKYYMSSEDKTDSDNDDHLRTLRQRKKTGTISNLSKTSFLDSKTEETRTRTKKVEGKSVKSSTLSLNSKTKSLDKTTENSDVFNFASDSKNEKKILEKNKKSKKDIELKRNALLTNSRSVFNRDCDNTLQNISPRLGCISVDNIVSVSSPSHKNAAPSGSPVIIKEISSQLSNIKKELETLEAMRLADLKKRMCEV